MNAPLPELPPLGKSLERARKPFTGLNVMCSIDALSIGLSALFYLVFLKPNADPLVPQTILRASYAVMIGLMAINLFFLWRGSNFARWIYWMFLAIGLLGLPSSAGQTLSLLPQLEKLHFWLGSLYSLGAGIWLATPGVARHFTTPKQS